MKKQNKYNRFQKYYKAVHPELRQRFIIALSQILNLAYSTIYQRIQNDNFNAEERAKIAYHLAIPQQILFPERPNDVVVSETYKANFEPLYKNLFSENGYPYDPDKIIEFLVTDTPYIID